MSEFRYFNYQLFVRTEDAASRSLKERTKRGKIKDGWVEPSGRDDDLKWVMRGTEVNRK